MDENKPIKQPAQQQTFSKLPIDYNDPLVIGAGALALGFILGSGHAKWLGHQTKQVTKGLGSLALFFISKSLQEKNPRWFSSRERMTH